MIRCLKCKKDKDESNYFEGLKKCKECISEDVKKVNDKYPASTEQE